MSAEALNLGSRRPDLNTIVAQEPLSVKRQLSTKGARNHQKPWTQVHLLTCRLLTYRTIPSCGNAQNFALEPSGKSRLDLRCSTNICRSSELTDQFQSSGTRLLSTITESCWTLRKSAIMTLRESLIFEFLKLGSLSATFEITRRSPVASKLLFRRSRVASATRRSAVFKRRA